MTKQPFFHFKACLQTLLQVFLLAFSSLEFPVVSPGGQSSVQVHPQGLPLRLPYGFLISKIL